MSGSYLDCTDDDGAYRGPELCENLGDCYEAIEEMWFMIEWLVANRKSVWGFDQIAPQELKKMAIEAYYRCMRGEVEWPSTMKQQKEGGRG